MYDVLDDLKQLYRDSGISPGPTYLRSMERALGGGALAYGTPAMTGITDTVLSSPRMVAFNLVQNSIDEAKGAARIQVIADKYADEPLYKKMHRHVGEEMKHSRQFHDLVPATGYEAVQEEPDAKAADEVLDFDDELRAFICRVHSIEIRSWTVLRMYRAALERRQFPQLSDAALPVLADIMQDEINHVLYTGEQIDEWLREDPSLQTTLDECFAHTNRETWQDMATMMAWLAKNFPDVLRGQAADIELPDVRFVVGDLGPPVTLT